MKKMTLGERIKVLMLEKNIKSLNEFHGLLVKRFGEKALSRRSLTTIVNKQVMLRKNTVGQICAVLQCKSNELIKDTNALVGGWEHVHSSILLHNYAYQFLITNHQIADEITHPFSVEQLILRKNATVPVHIFKDEPENVNLCIYVTRGSLDVYSKNAGRFDEALKAGHCLNFVSSKNLYISSSMNRGASAIIIAHPGREKYYKDYPVSFDPGNKRY